MLLKKKQSYKRGFLLISFPLKEKKEHNLYITPWHIEFKTRLSTQADGQTHSCENDCTADVWGRPQKKKPHSHGAHLWIRDVHMVKWSMNTSQTGAGKVSWLPCNITHCISHLSTIFIHLTLHPTYLIIRANDHFPRK